MNGFRAIRIIASSEAKMFARSWIFRFFVLITFLSLGFLNWYFFIPRARTMFWMLRAIPPSIPYFNILFLTVLESLIVIFGASDSLQRDFSLDTYESIHARSFSNLGYMTGKTIGIMLPCLITIIPVLILSYVVNVVFVSDVPVDLKAYLFYPLVLTVPAILFMTSFSLTLNAVVKFKPLAMMIGAGYFILTFVYNKGILARLIDFSGIHLPLMPSEFVGLENLNNILEQRAVFVFASFGLIPVAAFFYRRLPQANITRRLTFVYTIVFMAAAVYAGNHFVGPVMDGLRLRAAMQTLNERYAAEPRARLTACDLDVKHNGDTLDVTASLTVTNPYKEQMDILYFSLNPGFTVKSVTSDRTGLGFERNLQILEVALEKPLMSGEEREIAVSYNGTVDDNACYPDIDPAERIGTNRLFTYVVNRRYGFITPDYILLTPECLWYPVSGIPYGLVFPEAHVKDFVDFTADVVTSDGLTVVSQGTVEKTDDGRFTIHPEHALPGLTLIAGNYEKKSMVVDGIEFSILYRPGHDYFSGVIKAEPETIEKNIQSFIQRVVEPDCIQYQSSQFMLVESPVQFHAYPRPGNTYMETSQPEMSIVPEKGFYIRTLDIEGLMSSYSEMYSRNNLGTDNESLMRNIMLNVVMSVVMNDDMLQSSAASRPMTEVSIRMIISRIMQSIYQPNYMPGYSGTAQLNAFYNSFESDKYPIFSTIMDYYRKFGNGDNQPMRLSRLNQPLLNEEIACMALQEDTFENILRNSGNMDTFNLCLSLKANQLFWLIQADIGSERFNNFLTDFNENHPFQSIDYDEFASAVEDEFGINLDGMIETWYNENRMPLYTVANCSSTETLDGEFTVYQTSLTITNTEPIPGVVCIQYISLNQEGTNIMTPKKKFIKFEGHQTKEIGIVTEGKIYEFSVNMVVAKNLPLIHSYYFQDPKIDHSLAIFEGERLLEYAPPENDPNMIVVDNLDEGFEILSEPVKTKGDDRYNSIYQFGMYPEGYISFIATLPPQRWGKAVLDTAYGIKQTAMYTRCGEGAGCAAWNAEVPDQGTYELEFYIADFSSSSVRFGDDPMGNRPLLGDYNLTLKFNGQQETVAFYPEESNPGWQYVGSYNLDPGTATVELNNDTPGRLVYADAIRWIKQD
ncbi:hypothetical protein ACFL6K_04780 [Candidatus Latescibacterota bacterium]